MSKRFTDTDKWKKQFLRRLDAPVKLLWLYILDDCGHAGIGDGDWEVADLPIGLDIPPRYTQLGHTVFTRARRYYRPSFGVLAHQASRG